MNSDKFTKKVLLIASFIVLIVAGGIVLSLTRGAIPAFREFGLRFIITNEWNPTTGHERYGALPFITGTLVTSVIVSFLGVIGFIGLICPHMARRIIGDDHRFLVPFTCILGGALLLLADTVARVILLPHVLPVAILTSFLGAPVFIFLLIKGYKK